VTQCFPEFMARCRRISDVSAGPPTGKLSLSASEGLLRERLPEAYI